MDAHLGDGRYRDPVLDADRSDPDAIRAKAHMAPLSDVSISDCDFGTPRDGARPWLLHNARDVRLRNVRIAGKVCNLDLKGRASRMH